jgi:cation diffusion facilitator CzcD-associated flavoprotein CzcO
MAKVAVIGAGPAGLVAARYLKSEGFEPAIFERGDRVGGQWTGDPRFSGVWPSMRTNTARIATAFSDLAHPQPSQAYPTNQAMQAYLQAYAERFDLIPRTRFGTAVKRLQADARNGGWTLQYKTQDGASAAETYSHVVVAAGRFSKPAIPAVPGLDSFRGRGRLVHTFGYKHPERYRGRRVLVAGGSVSALEVASDLAMLGASVISCQRRQRYVLPKLFAGVPHENLVFNRFNALAGEYFPAEATAQALKDLITRGGGSPEQFGAARPADNVFEGGLTLSHYFLPLVAEGRIVVKPWLSAIEGTTVRFADGSSEEVDAIVFGTGYDLNLPFLGPAVRRALDLDAQHLDLHKLTFHPGLPGLAFIGIAEIHGPNLPVFELQARWIAYAWSGSRPMPSTEELEAGIRTYRAGRGGPQGLPMNALALMFAREAGVEPEPQDWPDLARALFFGPLSGLSFRLSGRDRLADAPQRVMHEAAAFGAMPSSALTPEQRGQLQALAAARQDAAFARFVDGL